MGWQNYRSIVTTTELMAETTDGLSSDTDIIQAHQRNTRAMPPLDNRGRLAPPSDQREAERRPDPPQL